MEERNSLPSRSLRGILDETFVIYGKNFRNITWVSAAIHAPLGVILYLLIANFTVPSSSDGGAAVETGGLIRFFVAVVLWVYGSIFAYAALAVMVAFHYFDDVSPARCYSRVGWRAVSLFLTASVMALAVLLPILLSQVANPVFVLFIFPVMWMFVSWSAGVQAIVIEGARFKSALTRSFGLVTGSRLKILVYNMVFLLTAFGLSIVLTLPYFILLSITQSLESTVLNIVLAVVANVVTFVAIPPVFFVAGTLLYLDLRVKKENFNLENLSQEMGIARA